MASLCCHCLIGHGEHRRWLELPLDQALIIHVEANVELHLCAMVDNECVPAHVFSASAAVRLLRDALVTASISRNILPNIRSAYFSVLLLSAHADLGSGKRFAGLLIRIDGYESAAVSLYQPVLTAAFLVSLSPSALFPCPYRAAARLIALRLQYEWSSAKHSQ